MIARPVVLYVNQSISQSNNLSLPAQISPVQAVYCVKEGIARLVDGNDFASLRKARLDSLRGLSSVGTIDLNESNNQSTNQSNNQSNNQPSGSAVITRLSASPSLINAQSSNQSSNQSVDPDAQRLQAMLDKQRERRERMQREEAQKDEPKHQRRGGRNER